MAEYIELAELLSATEPTWLRRRVMVSSLIKANAVRQETAIDPAIDPDGATAQKQRRTYAQRIFNDVFSEKPLFRLAEDAELILHRDFEAVYRTVIMSNSSLTVAQIQGASDAQIQTAVDGAFEFLAST